MGLGAGFKVEEPLNTISNTKLQVNRVIGRRGSNNNTNDGNNPYSVSDARSFNPYLLEQMGNDFYPTEH